MADVNSISSGIIVTTDEGVNLDAHHARHLLSILAQLSDEEYERLGLSAEVCGAGLEIYGVLADRRDRAAACA